LILHKVIDEVCQILSFTVVRFRTSIFYNNKCDKTPFIYLTFRTSIDFDSIKYVRLVKFEKKTNFKKVFSVDTFEITSTKCLKGDCYKSDVWTFKLDTLSNFDYQLVILEDSLINKKLFFSNIIVKKKEVYRGVILFIDSFELNNIKYKNTHAFSTMFFD
jgi:hypothetical protein